MTQSNYLARATVLAAVERFGWWDWDKPPRSEADVHQLSTPRNAANRLRLLRRRGRRLHLTTRGVEFLASPDRLWEQVASETEDGEDFTRAVTELAGLRLLQGRVEQRKLVGEIAPILIAQGWPGWCWRRYAFGQSLWRWRCSRWSVSAGSMSLRP